MPDILQQIVADKRIEVAGRKQELSLSELSRRVESTLASGTAHKVVSMSNSLANSSSGIIAEFKRRSPSKGWINEAAQPEKVGPAYNAAGASAISVLTDEKYFGGCADFLRAIRQRVDCPLLRKDFIIDEYQLFEAREMGADAVLLIAACLSPVECRQLAATAHQLGLETLLEIHSLPELEYVGANIDMVGVNNRHLGTFHTDVATSFALASKLPEEYVLVSESGISNPDTVGQLRGAGFRGFLIGETFMRNPDPGASLAEFISKIPKQSSATL